MSIRILVVDDEPAIVHALKMLLAREGYEITDTGDGRAAVDLLHQESFSLMISDIYMDPVDGLELLRVAREQAPTMPVIMITAFGSVDSAVQAMRQGAFDYITKPFRFNDLIQTVQRALAYGQAQAAGGESDILRIRYYYQQLAGDSALMRRVYQAIENVAPTDQPVLIIGEPGTGRTLVARVIHNHSGSLEHNLITVDCAGGSAALQQVLITEGGLVAAQRGTLLLENLHQADTRLQKQLPALLQRLRGPEVEAEERVRVIATSVHDLHQLVQNNQFDDETYYHLAAVPIDIPPLRERREDLPILIQHFLNRYEDRAQRQVTISLAALKALETYNWPGNLRELRDAIASAAERCRHQAIQIEDLPPVLQAPEAGGTARTTDDDASEFRWRNLRAFLKAKEHQYLKQVLDMTGGNRQRAAEVLAISLEEFNRKYDQN